MNTLVIVLVLLVIGVAVLAVIALKLQARQPPAKYKQTKPLTEPEQVLYWRLVEALPECVILSQVTFSRFMRPDAAAGGYQALRNKIAQKSADFLVCLKDFTVVATVELDDGSHNDQADRVRDGLLKSAGITVLRVKGRDIPSAEQIREMFAGENGGTKG